MSEWTFVLSLCFLYWVTTAVVPFCFSSGDRMVFGMSLNYAPPAAVIVLCGWIELFLRLANA
jgi:hypothetical protein